MPLPSGVLTSGGPLDRVVVAAIVLIGLSITRISLAAPDSAAPETVEAPETGSPAAQAQEVRGG